MYKYVFEEFKKFLESTTEKEITPYTIRSYLAYPQEKA
jgi:hypothetical protein